MTLFTANGILVGQTRSALQKDGSLTDHVARAYLDWLKTQISAMDRVKNHDRRTPEGGYSWLLDIPELYARKAPGATCTSALSMHANGRGYGILERPINDSKDCGGIMRVAPLALAYRSTGCADSLRLDKLGARLTAITHGHPLGYMPAAVITHIIG